MKAGLRMRGPLQQTDKKMTIQAPIKTAFLLAIIILSGMRSFDGGDCVRIYGEFKLKSGEIVKGYTHSGRVDLESAEKDLKSLLP